MIFVKKKTETIHKIPENSVPYHVDDVDEWAKNVAQTNSLDHKISYLDLNLEVIEQINAEGEN